MHFILIQTRSVRNVNKYDSLFILNGFKFLMLNKGDVENGYIAILCKTKSFLVKFMKDQVGSEPIALALATITHY